MEKNKIDFNTLRESIKLTTFLERYTILNPKGGIYHRINGKATGKLSKTKELTQDDKLQLRNGLVRLKEDIDQVIKGFENDLENDKI